MTERNPANYLDYTSDIDALVTALREIIDLTETQASSQILDKLIRERAEKALEDIGLVP